MVRTEESAEVDGVIMKLGDFLLRVCFIFGDFARRGFAGLAGFVYPVKAPIDCD